MKKFGEFICKNKILVIIISSVLIVLSVIGMNLTKINYDILVYLPENIDTIKGQNILTEDFNMGSYSMAIVENIKQNDLINLEKEIKNIDGVNEAISIYDLVGTTIPLEILPEDIIKNFYKDNTSLLCITFSDSTSSEKTINAVNEIRNLSTNVKQGGMSSMVLDTMNLSEKEITIYVIIAVILCLIVLILSLDSYIIPFILLLNIGCAILFNLGTNVFFDQISYITKALVAILQLGVTTDFSIFLYHSYEKKKNNKNKVDSMIEAISDTFVSVAGSSLTTIAGFLVLCTMQLTLGKDLGIVMAKGVLIGVICVLTLFPSLLLIFDNLIEKTKHKPILPNFNKFNTFIVNNNKAFLIVFIILLFPMYKAYSKIEVYYKLDESLPKTLESIKTNEILKDKFNMVSPEIILINKNIKIDNINKMINEIEDIDGIENVLSFSKLKSNGITENMLSDNIVNLFENDKYQIILLNSSFDIATNELNNQTEKINKIISKYDKNSILAGEGPLMKDLTDISDKDFKNVNISSIICIFIILFIVLKSLSLPFILIATIEFAIFTNMGISYFNGTILPFISPIVLGTIQLGATIDYAILMTSTYLSNREKIKNKKQAMIETLNYCGTSIFVSGMCFFAATIGVGIYSDIEMIGSLCTLISRGAIISMLVVIVVLPSLLITFDKLIMKTTRKGENKMKNEVKKIVIFISLLLIPIIQSSALIIEKDETVYSKLNYDGTLKNTIVNEQLYNINKLNKLDDNTELKEILNLSNDSTFKQKKDSIIWNAEGKNIFYQGTTTKDLPIKVKVTYKLNGKEKKLDDILGKKGKITIIINYTNTDKHIVKVDNKYENLYTPFIVTMATTLDQNNNSNISINNGKIINNGTNYIIAGISTPGLYESLNIDGLKDLNTIKLSFNTSCFELPNIYSVITPKVIDNNDLKIFDKMNDVTDQMSSLQSNMNKIDSGAKKLSKGSNKLKNGLKESLNKLSQNNENTLSSEQLDLIKKQTVSKVKENFTNEYKNQISDTAWNEVKKSLSNSNDKTIENNVTNTATILLTAYLGGNDNLKYYMGCAGGNENACLILESNGYNMEEINSFKNALSENLSSLTTTTTMYVAENITKEVSVSTSENTAIETASNVSISVANEVANQVKNASIKEISSSLNTLYDGVSQLDDGINSLSEGITKYNTNGIKKLNNIVNNDIKGTSNKVKELINLSHEYNSFTDSKSTYEKETKFVLVIDSKKIQKEVKKIDNNDTKTNFWQRIKNLFK